MLTSTLLLLPLPFASFLLSLSSLSLSWHVNNIPALIVFGDSTVDAGNNNFIKTIVNANFPPYGRDFPGGRSTGRFCNGRLSTDIISEALGLPPIVPAYLDPSYTIRDFAKGVCFASAGTGFDVATSDLVSVIPLMEEINLFQEYIKRLRRYAGGVKAMHIVNEAIYIISIGTNDFVENYFPTITGRSNQYTLEEFEDFLVGTAGEFITRIYRLGARKIAFTGLSPFGCVPVSRTLKGLLAGGGDECLEEFNQAARGFNAKLQRLIRRLCASLPGLRLRYMPIYDYISYIIKNPSLFGFENVKEGCCGTGKLEISYLCNEYDTHTCLDADKYLFWDAIHPSQQLNRLVANQSLTYVLSEFLSN